MPKRKNKLVAIVEDNQPFRELMQKLITLLGYAVEAFPSAASFLASPFVVEVACLVADVNMPGMTGPELHRHLKNAGHKIPTILVTAYPDEIVRERALKMGSSAISANQWTTTISNDASVRRCDPVRLQSRTHEASYPPHVVRKLIIQRARRCCFGLVVRVAFVNAIALKIARPSFCAGELRASATTANRQRRVKMPMLDERARESSVQPLRGFAFDQQIGSFAPCVPHGGSAAESGTIVPSGRVRGGSSPKTVRRIREYIDDHIGQRIRVELLAKLAISQLLLC